MPVALRPTVTRVALVVLLVALAMPPIASAQTRALRLEGRVLWVAGNVLSLAVNDGPAVTIDLRGVPQGDYYGLVQGDWVVVLGQLSPDYRRVLGTSITRYAGSQAP